MLSYKHTFDKMKTFFIFFSVVATITVVSGKTYCNMACKNYQTNGFIKHIGCDHNKLFNKYNCPTNARIVPITDSLKNMLVDAHNEKRNFIAGGGDPNHKPACRMATMQWDNELAYLAELNVKQCKMEHDKCHNTETFKYSGQNLAISRRKPAGVFDDARMLQGAVQNWFNEVKDSKQSYIDSYPDNYYGPQIGHFTVMMADDNIRVGCSAAIYNNTDGTNFLTGCNYATTNMIGEAIYENCNVGGEHCKTGRNPKFTNLCRE